MVGDAVSSGDGAQRRRRRRVLVVERLSTLRHAYTRILSAAGYDAVPAADPVDARSLLGFGAPDVAVVEVGGSVPGGVALIAELQVRRIPVLAVAPTGEPECAARRAGAGAFLSRPFGPHVLLPAVGVLLDGVRGRAPVPLHECGGASDDAGPSGMPFRPVRG